MEKQNEKTPFYRKNWFVILMIIFLFPIGLILMWMQTNWKKSVKWVVTVVVLLIAFTAGSGDNDAGTTANNSSEDVEIETADESTEETESEEEIGEREPVEKEVENKDVITIAEEHDYVIDASLIEEPYAAKIDGEVQNFNPEDEKHYKIQLEHHGGFTGSKNLDRFKELVEDITNENAEYDYLVLEAIREKEDGGELERLNYTRFNPEQAQALLAEDEVNDDVFEKTADFHIHGITDTDVGLNETIIGVNEEISFSEFTVTVRNVIIEDDEAKIDMMFKNDSAPDGLRFISALGMDVYQGDTLLDETSGEIEDKMGSNSGVYYQHDRGIESPIDLSYGPINEDEPLRIVFTPLLYEFEDGEEITIDLK